MISTAVANPIRQTSVFQIVESDALRQDPGGRTELKFALSQADPAKLRRLLEGNCRRLLHDGPVSSVCSVYFDDAQLSTCRANLIGVGLRRKVRLRWYDTPLPPSDFFLEVKWRKHRVTGKHRLRLRSQQPLAELSYAQIRQNLDMLIPEPLAPDWLQYNEPTALVRYSREHFTSDDGLRLTLDYNISYYDQTGRHAISTAFPHRHEGLVVLEGKVPVGREAELRRWLFPFAARVSRCSKYVHACSRLGLIRGMESY
jgi:hypothetical protein